MPWPRPWIAVGREPAQTRNSPGLRAPRRDGRRPGKSAGRGQRRRLVGAAGRSHAVRPLGADRVVGAPNPSPARRGIRARSRPVAATSRCRSATSWARRPVVGEIQLDGRGAGARRERWTPGARRSRRIRAGDLAGVVGEPTAVPRSGRQELAPEVKSAGLGDQAGAGAKTFLGLTCVAAAVGAAPRTRPTRGGTVRLPPATIPRDGAPRSTRAGPRRRRRRSARSARCGEAPVSPSGDQRAACRPRSRRGRAAAPVAT